MKDQRLVASNLPEFHQFKVILNFFALENCYQKLLSFQFAQCHQAISSKVWFSKLGKCVFPILTKELEVSLNYHEDLPAGA